MIPRFSDTGRIARTRGAQALVTGDSIGQVASQTLENLAVVGQATTLPIFRPLIGMDKSEIVAEAAKRALPIDDLVARAVTDTVVEWSEFPTAARVREGVNAASP